MAQKTFIDRFNKTLVPLEELQTMQRDLSFYPGDPQQAATLTAEQVESFNRDGFILPIRVFDEDEIAAYRAYFDVQLAQSLASGCDSYSMIDPHVSHSRVYDLMFEPRFVDRVRDLLGPNIVCWSGHYFCKMPHDDKQVSWHQDAYYWPLTPSKTVSVWLAIDDADPDNACMQFIAGSHLYGAIDHRITRDDEKNVLRLTVDGVERYGNVVDDQLKAGEISLHSDLLLHGSGPNPSDRRRCGMVLRYADAAVKDLRDWYQTGVIICGQDRRGQWSNPPRPRDE